LGWSKISVFLLFSLHPQWKQLIAFDNSMVSVNRFIISNSHVGHWTNGKWHDIQMKYIDMIIINSIIVFFVKYESWFSIRIEAVHYTPTWLNSGNNFKTNHQWFSLRGKYQNIQLT
jgi:hypothetical protein